MKLKFHFRRMLGAAPLLLKGVVSEQQNILYHHRLEILGLDNSELRLGQNFSLT